jgi:hypothetical protein
LLIHTHGHIEVSHYAFRSFENTAEGIGMVLWNLQSEDLGFKNKTVVIRERTSSLIVDTETLSLRWTDIVIPFRFPRAKGKLSKSRPTSRLNGLIFPILDLTHRLKDAVS